MREGFHFHERPNPHTTRGREIIRKYPQVRELMGPYALSGPYILGVVALQFGVAYALKDSSWWLILLVSYLIGAICNHALFAMLHEACHDLVSKSKTANRIWGIICNFPQALPSAIGFRKFHLVHHSHLAEYDFDADLANHWEAKLVKSSWWRKTLWYLFFSVVESIRPMRLKSVDLWDRWVVANLVVVVMFDFAVFYFFGFKPLAYFLLSTFFGIGLHPVGARWIQEHYIFNGEQETYSYYGPLNKVSFNVGYHNEHHDLFRVPWVNLPKLKAIAPEYYDTLYSHKSWTKVLLTFIFNPRFDLYARNVRKSRESALQAQEMARS